MFKKTASRLAAACLFASVLTALPATASADRRDDDRRRENYDRGERYRRDDYRGHSSGRVDIHIGGGSAPYCAPPPRVVEETVWVEPVYRTVTDRVWVEPVVERIPDRTWVPDRHEWRDVVRYDRHGRRYCSREYVLVEPAHFVECTREVVVRPGRWETCTRQELVCAGHYETRPIVVAPPPPVRNDGFARIDLRFPIGR
jgi:hypothetical protein